MGLGYHWSLDFASPLVVTPRGVKYVLEMVEHFSTWIEFVVLSQNFAKLVAASFLDRKLARFGALAKVLTDQRREFLGAFEELCTKALIDHRTTSRDHLKVDGLAERVVQTTKRGLRNMDYFGGAIGIGTLCCLWLLWTINLVSMHFWRPTARISCCTDVSLYSRVLFGKN